MSNGLVFDKKIAQNSNRERVGPGVGPDSGLRPELPRSGQVVAFLVQPNLLHRKGELRLDYLQKISSLCSFTESKILRTFTLRGDVCK